MLHEKHRYRTVNGRKTVVRQHIVYSYNRVCTLQLLIDVDLVLVILMTNVDFTIFRR